MAYLCHIDFTTTQNGTDDGGRESYERIGAQAAAVGTGGRASGVETSARARCGLPGQRVPVCAIVGQIRTATTCACRGGSAFQKRGDDGGGPTGMAAEDRAPGRETEQQKKRDMKVGVIMGSTSDYEVMADAVRTLEEFGVEFEKRVVSAHRTPDLLCEYAKTARGRGLGVIIAGAGGAANLPGMVPPRPRPAAVDRTDACRGAGGYDGHQRSEERRADRCFDPCPAGRSAGRPARRVPSEADVRRTESRTLG